LNELQPRSLILQLPTFWMRYQDGFPLQKTQAEKKFFPNRTLCTGCKKRGHPRHCCPFERQLQAIKRQLKCLLSKKESNGKRILKQMMAYIKCKQFHSYISYVAQHNNCNTPATLDTENVFNMLSQNVTIQQWKCMPSPHDH